MISKYRFPYTLIFSLFFSFVFHLPLLSMDNSQEEIPLFYEELRENERHDPLFFKLITAKGHREIYIIGSNHIVHPKNLLSEPVFNKLKELSNRATLFTEHSSIYEHLKPQEPINSPGEGKWNPEQLLAGNSLKIWNLIVKQEIKFDEAIPIESIQYIQAHNGIMLFYSYASDKFREIFMGFETTLRTWKQSGKWIGDIEYLEDVDEFLDIFSRLDQTELKPFLTRGLTNYNKVFYYYLDNGKHRESVLKLVLEELKKTINTYRYEDYQEYNGVESNVLKRNKKWAAKLVGYLEKHGNDEAPIVIVCGAAHLRGYITKKCGSFLEKLWNTGLFESIERINRHGENSAL